MIAGRRFVRVKRTRYAINKKASAQNALRAFLLLSFIPGEGLVGRRIALNTTYEKRGQEEMVGRAAARRINSLARCYSAETPEGVRDKSQSFATASIGRAIPV